MSQRTHIIVRRRYNRKAEYFMDCDRTGRPITTDQRSKALHLSMLGAVAIAKELDQTGGWGWHVEPL